MAILPPKKPPVSAIFFLAHSGRRRDYFRYNIIRVWERPVDEILAGNIASLPLAPISRVSSTELPAVLSVLRRMTERFETEAEPQEIGDYWAATYGLMGLVYPESISKALLQGVRKMRESVTYRAILREGRALGRAEARLEGRLEIAKSIIRRQATKRFGPPCAAIIEEIDAHTDIDRLELLCERVLYAANWDELMADGLIEADTRKFEMGDTSALTMNIPTPARSRPDFRLPASHEAFARANRVIPGGVNSPARAFGAVGGEPPFMARASGAYLFDIDDHKYIDYIGSWGPMILGHVHPQVRSAVVDALDLGSSFGAPTVREIEIAEAVARGGSVDRESAIRFIGDRGGHVGRPCRTRSDRPIEDYQDDRTLPWAHRLSFGPGRLGRHHARDAQQPGSDRGGRARHDPLPLQ
jgi:hypothetical protein